MDDGSFQENQEHQRRKISHTARAKLSPEDGGGDGGDDDDGRCMMMLVMMD